MFDHGHMDTDLGIMGRKVATRIRGILNATEKAHTTCLSGSPEVQYKIGQEVMEQLFKVNKPNISLSVAVNISSLVLECTNDVEPRGMILAKTTFALDRQWRFLVLHGTRDVKLLGRSRAPVDLRYLYEYHTRVVPWQE